MACWIAPTYVPAIEKGWRGLVSHIYNDGRLGCIQPDLSYVYGAGAFLLAGSEVPMLHAHS